MTAMVEIATNRSRREFLKRMLVLGATVVVDPWVAAVQRPLAQLERISLPIATEVKFDFDKHTFEPMLLEGNPTILLGELPLWGIDSWRGETNPYEGTQPDAFADLLGRTQSTYVSEIDYCQHVATLMEARRRGIQVVATDEEFFGVLPEEQLQQLLEVYGQNDLRKLAVIVLGGLWLTGLGHRGFKKLSPRFPATVHSELVKTILAPLLAAGVMSWAYADAERRRWLAELLASDNPTSKMLVRLIGLRNLTMALNTHLVEASIKANPALATALLSNNPGSHIIKIIFRAGNGHSGAQRDYQRGQVWLDRQLLDRAQEVIAFSQRVISSEADQVKRQTLVFNWLLLTAAFTYPIPSWTDFPEYQQAPNTAYLPAAPRTILWQELLKQVQMQPADTTIIEMIRALTELDYSFQRLNPNPTILAMSCRADRLSAQATISLESFGATVAGKTLRIVEGIPWLNEA